MYYNHTNTEDVMPKVIKSEELDADQFRAGDVWESPRGVRYTVTRVTMRVAHLVSETTHRTVFRVCDDLGGGPSGRPWVRISSGAEKKL
jgi:hypothetical protein